MKRQLLVLTLMMFGILFAEWTIVETYPIPENTSGLAWDGEYLYCGSYGANRNEIYRIDPLNGSVTLLFNSTLGYTYGMTWDGSNLWVTDHSGGVNDPAQACKLDMQGNVLEQITLPSHYMSGIAWDGGYFWVEAYADPNGYIYRIDNQGNILTGFDAPYYQPWGLCTEGACLWVVDNWSNEIYKIDSSNGSVLANYTFRIEDPTGIVFDGTYFWFCEEGTDENDLLHKVDPNGEGMAEIELDWEEYDFGEVVIGTPETVTLPISSNGTCALSISGCTFEDDAYSISEDIPIVIELGTTFDLEITCDPSQVGALPVKMDITTNDFYSPTASVWLTSFALDTRPRIVVQPDVIHFGTVRLGALTGRNLWIVNMGIEDLVVSGISNEAGIYLEDNLELPLVISSRDSVRARIWLDADQQVNIASEIVIESNDPAQSILNISVDANVEPFSQEIGTEYWHFQTNVTTSGIPTLKKFIDINGDGIDEVIASDHAYHTYCLNGNSSGEADILWQFDLDYSSGLVLDDGLSTADDLNGDNILDVVIGSQGENGSVYALNGLNGEIIWQFDLQNYGGGRVHQIDGRRDYNGDGVCDFLAATLGDFDAITLLNGADGEVEWIANFSDGRSAVSSIDDQNMDGIPDVICCGGYSSYDLTLLSGADGSILFFFEIRDNIEDIIDINDVNGDHIQDIVYGSFFGSHACLDYNQEEIWNVNDFNLLIEYDRAFHNGTEYLVPVMMGEDVHLTINAETGEYGALYTGVWNFCDCSPINDIDGDGHFDILCGDYDDQAIAVSGSDGSEIWIMDFDHSVDRVCPADDLDSNNSSEMLFGVRNGEITCRSGGTNASAQWGALTIDVATNSGYSAGLAHCLITGNGEYSGVVPEDGILVIPEVAYGLCSVYVTMDFHHPFARENIEVTSGMVIDVLLREIISPVENFRADIDGYDLTLLWDTLSTQNRTKQSRKERVLATTRLFWNNSFLSEVESGQGHYNVGTVSPGTHVFSAVNVYSTGESEPVEIEVSVVHNDDPGIKPYETALLGNTPNPFNPSTAIRFSLREDMPVTLAIYNIRGQKVRTLIDKRMERGEHTAQWLGDDDSGKPCSSGVYLYRMQTAGKTETKKMIMMK